MDFFQPLSAVFFISDYTWQKAFPEEVFKLERSVFCERVLTGWKQTVFRDHGYFIFFFSWSTDELDDYLSLSVWPFHCITGGGKKVLPAFPNKTYQGHFYISWKKTCLEFFFFFEKISTYSSTWRKKIKMRKFIIECKYKDVTSMLAAFIWPWHFSFSLQDE